MCAKRHCFEIFLVFASRNAAAEAEGCWHTSWRDEYDHIDAWSTGVGDGREMGAELKDLTAVCDWERGV